MPRDPNRCPECDGPCATWEEICGACRAEIDGIRPAINLPAARKLPPKGTPCVYAATAINISDCAIKFGFSTDPLARLETLRIGSPVLLRLVAVSEGPKELERCIHMICRPDRMHGEWFARTKRTLGIVQILHAGKGLDLLAGIGRLANEESIT